MNTIQQKYVIDFYDKYYKDFDNTRYYVWPHIKSFVTALPAYSYVLDVGCGNGKNTFRRDLLYDHCDISLCMCALITSKNKSATHASVTNLPYKSNSFDAVLCIACIHHLNTQEQRQKAISECIRVVKPGGRLLISLWKNNSKYSGDSYVKWKTNDVLRYYHMYGYDEVLEHCKNYSNYSIDEDAQNFYLTLYKCEPKQACHCYHSV